MANWVDLGENTWWDTETGAQTWSMTKPTATPVQSYQAMGYTPQEAGILADPNKTQEQNLAVGQAAFERNPYKDENLGDYAMDALPGTLMVLGGGLAYGALAGGALAGGGAAAAEGAGTIAGGAGEVTLAGGAAADTLGASYIPASLAEGSSAVGGLGLNPALTGQAGALGMGEALGGGFAAVPSTAASFSAAPFTAAAGMTGLGLSAPLASAGLNTGITALNPNLASSLSLAPESTTATAAQASNLVSPATGSDPMKALSDWVTKNPVPAAQLGLGAAGLLGTVASKINPEDEYKSAPIDQSIVGKYGGVPAMASPNYQGMQGPSYQGFQTLGTPQGLLQMRLDKMKRGLL